MDENGCVTSEDFSITESEALSIETSITECINNDGIITTNVVGGTPNYSYNLIYEEEVLETNSTGIFSNLNSGTYSVTAYDSFNCDITETITLNSGPIAEFTVDEYEFSLSNIPTEFLDLSIDDNIINWEWEFGDGSSSNEQNPSHLYLNPGIYYITLTITDLYNCQDVITKEIKVLQDFYSYTPNIFTPNNDGMNDTFAPSLLNINMNTYNLLVYDRWGKKLFETTDYNQGWDGKLKDGTLMPPDVYSYKITYQTNLGVEKKEIGRIIMAR